MRAGFCVFVLLLLTGVAGAQQTPPPPAAQDQASAPAPPAAGAAVVPEAWATQCTGLTRQGALTCAMEQRVIQQETGQMVALFSIRVPGDTRTAAMAMQLPLGLLLEAGLTIRIDGADAQALSLRTCDGNGCYAGGPVSEDLLSKLRAGTAMVVVVQNLSGVPIEIPMSLANFAAVFDSIR